MNSHPLNFRNTMLVLGLFLTGMTACHHHDDSGTAADIIPSHEVELNVDGAWTGTTSQANSVAFSISGSRLQQFVVGVNICSGNRARTITYTSNQPLVSGNSVSISTDQVTSTIVFTSTTQASGSVTATDTDNCPDTARFTFNAVK
jgi:hypothetical protein